MSAVLTRLKPAVDAALRWSPAQPLFRWRASRRLTVLAYHGADDVEVFSKHLSFVRRHLHAVSLDQVVSAAVGRSGLPRRAVLITFDDGHRSVADLALPLLNERGLPAVVFVVAGLLDTQAPFWWEEASNLLRIGARAGSLEGKGPNEAIRVLKLMSDDDRIATIDSLRGSVSGPVYEALHLQRRELAKLEANGIDIGNHTLTHRMLSRCSNDTLRREIVESHRIIESALGHSPRAFAYPDGDPDKRAIPILRSLGYAAAFLFDHRDNRLPLRDPFRISRLRVNSHTSMERFQIITSGLHPALHRVHRATINTGTR